MINFRSGGFRDMPPVVKNLLIINVLVFLTQNLLARSINIDDLFALHYWRSPHFRWWQLFTHMFMHASLAHIFFNMFALWMFGRILENVWGPQRFLMFYLICGLGAALCHLSVLGIQFGRFFDAFTHYQHNPTFVEFAQFIRKTHSSEPVFNKILTFWGANPDCADCAQTSIRLISEKYTIQVNEATVGASGAVFGLLFAFGYLFPNTELMLLFPPIPIKAKWFVAGYALIELYSGMANSAGDNIAHFAHLGGMLFAFILLRIWKSRVRDRFY
jgi:membrane associated rhomboid family serine protease